MKAPSPGPGLPGKSPRISCLEETFSFFLEFTSRRGRNNDGHDAGLSGEGVQAPCVFVKVELGA